MYNRKWEIEKMEKQKEKNFNILYRVSCIIKAIFGIM